MGITQNTLKEYINEGKLKNVVISKNGFDKTEVESCIICYVDYSFDDGLTLLMGGYCGGCVCSHIRNICNVKLCLDHLLPLFLQEFPSINFMVVKSVTTKDLNFLQEAAKINNYQVKGHNLKRCICHHEAKVYFCDHFPDIEASLKQVERTDNDTSFIIDPFGSTTYLDVLNKIDVKWIADASFAMCYTDGSGWVDNKDDLIQAWRDGNISDEDYQFGIDPDSGATCVVPKLKIVFAYWVLLPIDYEE